MASQDLPDVGPGDIDKHLGHIEYPADKQDLKQQAQRQDLPGEVIDMIDHLPDEDYRSADDVATTYAEVQ